MPPAITTEPVYPRRRNSLGRLVVFLVAASVWPTAWGFASAAIGDVLDDAVLPGLDGTPHHLLTDATVNVFVFFKPGQKHSDVALRQFARLEKELAGKPVRWVAIMSDRIPRAEAEAARQAAGVAMPVLIDVGDALFGRLGVTLAPCVGITDRDHRLVAYQPFTKVNYLAVIRARILHLLKEIDDDALERVLHPPAVEDGGVTVAAHRRFKLAQRLFAAGQYPKALENVTLSLQKDDRVAAAHALRGQILAALGEFAEARLAYDRALALDPADVATAAARAALPARDAQA